MNRISRYILAQTAVVMVFMTVVLSFVIWLTQSLRFVDMVVNRGLPVSEFLWLAMLILPRFLTVILPIACVIAVIYVYNKMIGDRELIVLRAAGLSNMRLTVPALVLSALAALAIAALNAWLLPVSYRQFTDMRFAIRSDYSTILLQEGAFHTLPGPISIFIRERIGAGQLNGILVHDGRDPDKPVTLMAESGILAQTEDGPRVVLVNGNRQELDRARNTLSMLHFDKHTIDLSVASEKVPSNRERNPEEMFLWDLFDPPQVSPRLQMEYVAEAHSRIAAPFLAFTFTLLGLAIVLSGDFSRRGQSGRVLAALLAVLLVQTLAITLHNMAGGNPRLVPLLYLNVVIPGLAGAWALMPGRRRKTAAARSRP